MPVNAELYPKRDLEREQFKALGDALWTWMYRNSSSRGACFLAIEDLRAGGPPKPAYLQKLTAIEGRSLSEELLSTFDPPLPTLSVAERDRIKEKLGSKAASRHVDLRISPPESFSRREIVEGLRLDISSEFVEDVLIEGTSWNQDIEFDHTYYRSDSMYGFLVPKPLLSEEHARVLGTEIVMWWMPTIWTMSLLVQSGLNSLHQGLLPLRIEEQLEVDSFGELVQGLDSSELDRRAVMFMVRKSMNVPYQIAKHAQKELPLGLLDELIIDEAHWRVVDYELRLEL